MSGRQHARPIDPGAAFMAALRRDHAGLSRVLREIDTQAGRLVDAAAEAVPVLIEAMRYLLRYQHAFHHPREDRLFARILGHEPALAEVLEGLSREHETGERETAELAEALEREAAAPGNPRSSARLARRLGDYVAHSRAHMRREEAVFYARAEAVLTRRDWTRIVDADGTQDPVADLAALAAEYPQLAARLGLSLSLLAAADPSHPVNERLRRQLVALTDVYGGLMHDAVDLTRLNLERLRAVRGPSDLLRAAGAISGDNFRFASDCLSRPARWAVNTGAGLLVGWLGDVASPPADSRGQPCQPGTIKASRSDP